MSNAKHNGNPIDIKDWLSPMEASKELGMSIPSLRRFANKGKIVHLITDGGHRRYSRKSVEEFKMIPMSEKAKRERKEEKKEKIAYCRVS